MRFTDVLDPFKELTAPILERVFRERREEREAEQRFRRLLDTYRQIVQDSRYALVAEDLKAVLARELTQLVTLARKCGHCGAQAERITLLQEIISEPLQSVWLDHHRPAVVESGEDGAG